MPEFKLKNGATYSGDVEAEYEDRILLWNVTVKHPDGSVSTARVASINKNDIEPVTVEKTEEKLPEEKPRKKRQ